MAIAPVLPELAPIIIPIVLLCLFIVALGCVSLVRALVEAILGVVAHAVRRVPLIGGLASSAVLSAERSVADALGRAEAKIDARIGAYFHQVAKLIAWVGHELERHASLLHTISTVILGPAITRLIQEAVRLVHRSIAAARHELANLRRQALGTLPRTLHALDHRLTHRLAAIAGTLGHVIEWDIPRLRIRTGTLTRDLGRLWRHVRAVDRRWAALAFAGAVAVALARLGAGWVRCSNVGKAGRALCRTDTNWLESLLADGLAIIGIVSVVEFAEGLLAIEDEALSVMQALVREWPAG